MRNLALALVPVALVACGSSAVVDAPRTTTTTGAGAGGAGGTSSAGSGGAGLAWPDIVCPPLPEDCGAGSKLQPGSPWPTLGRCPDNHSRSPFAAAREPVLKWVTKTSKRANTRPALSADGTLYVAAATGMDPSDAGRLFAIDAKTGDVKWTFDLGAAVYWASPTIGEDGTIYLGSRDFFAIAPDGTERWRFEVPDPCVTPPRVESTARIGADGTVFIGASCSIYALDPASGAMKWAVDLGGGVQATPAVAADGTLFVPGAGVVALDPTNGATRWHWTGADATGWASPALADDGTLYVPSYDSSTGKPGAKGRWLFAVDTTTGLTKWTFETAGDWIYASPAIGCDGTVFTGGGDQDFRLYALDPVTRKPKWSYETPGDLWSSPTVDAHGIVYLGMRGGGVVAIDPTNGAERWRYETNADELETSIVIGKDGTLYAVAIDGRVFALGDPDAPPDPPVGTPD